jgi:hypothetical protein
LDEITESFLMMILDMCSFQLDRSTDFQRISQAFFVGFLAVFSWFYEMNLSFFLSRDDGI